MSGVCLESLYKMEGTTEVISHGTSVALVREEEDDDFRSCCEDEEVWKDTDEPLLIKEGSTEDLLDEFSVKMFFKGLSINGVGDSGSCVSGIGVFIERPSAFPVIKVQKKLDFYVEEPVADCLALMDGLTECLQNNIRRVYAFTDSELLYHQITNDKEVEIPLLEALKERILEHSSKLEAFVLQRVPSVDVDAPSKLAQVAMGVISFTPEGDSSVEICSICCEDKPCLMMITLKCSHKFCSGCMRSYADKKVQSSQVPIRCPQETCKYFVSSAECKSFLTSTSHDSFEKALREATVSYSNRIYCPFPSCSVLIDPLECLSARASSSSGSENNSCIECPDCGGSVCVDCGVPWHSAMSCEEYQSVPLEERDSSDITLSYRLPQNKRWRRCRQCRTMIELTQGCYHMTCRCGQEFCYSCGAEYNEGQKSCECAFWEEDNSEDRVTQSLQESEQWAWETFNSLPMIMDAYSDQEKSQLALIQRFLAGGFSLSDHHPYQSDNPPRCTDSYVDAMKDLHQLPWLERFVSVISDTYYEDYIQ